MGCGPNDLNWHLLDNEWSVQGMFDVSLIAFFLHDEPHLLELSELCNADNLILYAFHLSDPFQFPQLSTDCPKLQRELMLISH